MSTYQPHPPTQNPYPYPPQYSQQPAGATQLYPPMQYPQQLVMGRPEHPQATTVLVLGILGFVVAGVLGPVAWYMGNKALKECETGMYAVTDQLRVGRVLGIVCTILLIVNAAVAIFCVIVWLSIMGAVMSGI